MCVCVLVGAAIAIFEPIQACRAIVLQKRCLKFGSGAVGSGAGCVCALYVVFCSWPAPLFFLCLSPDKERVMSIKPEQPLPASRVFPPGGRNGTPFAAGRFARVLVAGPTLSSSCKSC